MALKKFSPYKKETPKLRLGSHVVKITEFEYMKEGGSIVYVPGTNNPKGISVTFTNIMGVSRKKNFLLQQNMLWLLDNLSSAIGIDLVGGDDYDVQTDIIGKELVIIVGRVIICKGGVPIIENGVQRSYLDIMPKFFRVEDRHLIKGEPDDKNPTGDYANMRNEWRKDK